MAISKLVTGNAFERPAITFSTKSTSNIQKASSSLLTNKSSMADLGDSMLKLNIQLEQMQAISMEIMKSISSVLKTIAKVDRDMTVRFRTLNKEMAASRTEFTRSLAAITPSLTGGAGATISAATLGPAAAAGTDPIPSSGNSTWDMFMAFVKIRAAGLFVKIGARVLAAAAGLAIPGIGWIATAVTLIGSIGLAWELYELWCEYNRTAIDPKEKEARDKHNGSGAPAGAAPPPGSPQGAQLTDMSMSGETGAFAAAAGSNAKGAGTPQGGAGPQSAASPPAATPPPAPPADMSIGGETGAFGAARQAASAPQPMRRPATEAAPAAVSTGKPQAAAPPVDPHAKSRAMFEAATEAEKNGGNGTALFFAADKQRSLELANLKSAAAQPGAPAEVKKTAAKSLQDPTNPATQGRGGGHMNGETMFGRGGGHMTGETMFGRGGGHMTGESTLGRGGGDHKSPLLEPIQGPMQSMADKQAAAIAGGMYDKDVADTSGKNVDAQRRQLESTAMNNARQQSGESLARIGAPVPDETGETTTGRAVTPMTIGGGIKALPGDEPGAPGLFDSFKNWWDGKPAGAPKAPEATQIEPEPTAPKAAAPTVINNTQQSTTGSTAGGDQTQTPNIPLDARNPDLAPYTQPTYAFGS